jgi:HicB family
MSTLTIRIPEGKHERLRALAKARGISINRLMDELATVALAEYDSETRFRAMAARGSKRTGLSLLAKLDRAFAENH